jgi:hypothetical protein
VDIDRVLQPVRSVPIWGWLAGLVIVSAGVRFALARQIVAPAVMVDELVYSELAKSLAAHGSLQIRGHAAATEYGWVYPILLSAPYRAFTRIPDVYVAAKAVNAFVMSLAAVPAYLLARRVLARQFALLVAFMAVAIPSMVYTGSLLTENAFYPLFMVVALLLVRVVDRPTRRNQLGLVALCLLAYETRQQALALFPAVVTATVIVGPKAVARFRLLYGVLAGAVLVAIVAEAGRGRSITGLLGAYSVTGHHHYSLRAVARWTLWHVAEFDLYLGLFPFAATLLLLLGWRKLERSQQALMATLVSLTAWMIVEVAAFASLPAVGRIEERDLFYLAPLFFTALLVWVQGGAPRPRLLAAGAAAVSAALIPTLPFTKLVSPYMTSDALALFPWLRLEEHGVSQLRLVAAVAAIALAVLFLSIPLRFAFIFPALLVLYFAVEHSPIESQITLASRNARAAGIGDAQSDWIDRRVGGRASVAAIWSGNVDPHVIFENEFFNRSVGPVYDLGAPLLGNLPSTPLQVASDGLLSGPDGAKLYPQYALTDDSVRLIGERRADDTSVGLTLWRLRPPMRSASRVTGLYPNDTWSGPVVAYRETGCAGGAVRITVLGDASLFHQAQTISSVGVVYHVRPGAPFTFTAPLRDCEVRFVISPTKVPGHGDSRRLGLRFLRFDYVPPGF